MSLTEKMNELLVEMEAVNAEIIQKTGGPAGSDTIVDHAPNADKLDGMTAGRVSDLLRERIRAHIETLGQNAHNLLPSDLGTYSSIEFNTKIDSYLDIKGNGPLSFYGDREYLPPTVTGSFESGVTWAPWSYVGMFLEDNGTLMMLRTGTDGVKAGVYYSYLRNALNTSLMSDIVMTNARYNPAYFPSDSYARSVLWGSQDLIIGILAHKVTGVITGYFVSLTNNTYDQSKHTGIVIPASSGIMNCYVSGDSALRGQPIGFLKGGTVYLLVNKDNIDFEAAGWKVYSIPKQNLIDSNYVAPTPITGWTINRGVEGVVSRTDLDYADTKNNLIILGSPRMYASETHRCNPAHYAKTMPDGRMVMDSMQYMGVWDNANLAQPIQWLMTTVFNFDPVSKVVDMSPYFNDKPTMTFNGDGTVMDWGNGKGNRYIRNTQSHINHMNGQATSRLFVTENNVAFVYLTSVLYTSRSLHRFTYAADATIDDILLGTSKYQAYVADAFEGRYASPVSFLMDSITNFGDLVLTGQNTGWNKNNKVARMFWRAGTDSTFTYQYGSLQTYNYLGNPPTPERAWLLDYPGNTEPDMYSTVNETDASGWRVHKGRFDNYVMAGRRSGAANITAAMVGTGTLSITPAAFDSLAAPLMADLAAQVGPPYGTPATVTQLWYEVILPQRYSDLPAFVYGHYVGADRVTYFFVYSLNVNNRQTVTAASLATATRMIVQAQHGRGTAVGCSFSVFTAGQVAIRRVDSGFLVGLVTTGRYSFIGNSVATCALLSWKPGVGWAMAMPIDYDQQQISNSNWVNMSHGLYLTFTTENHRGNVDCGTKLLGVLVSNGAAPNLNNLEEYRARFLDRNYARIFLSQQTVTAWTVYFADPTPVMIEGLYYELGVYAHYLNAGTDANKTFYCWAVREAGDTVRYHITTNPAIPTGFLGQLYLGFFTTNSAGLAIVAVEKRVAVGGVLISTTSRGNSIPVTSGVPNTPGRLNWR
jgi:hypothetical protein